MKKIRAPHLAKMKCAALLPVKYKVRELSAELHLPERTVRDWLYFAGAPHTRDSRNHIWIDGTDFQNWFKTKTAKPKKHRMNSDEAFCFKCNKPVELKNPQVIQVKAKLIRLIGNCIECGSKLSRGGRQNGSQ